MWSMFSKLLTAANSFLIRVSQLEKRSSSCLTPLTVVQLLDSSTDLCVFFSKSNQCLAVSGDFRQLVLKKATGKSAVVGERLLAYADLVEPANDDEINQDMPEGYSFAGADYFLRQLALLIETQSRSGCEQLLASGQSNLFHVQIADDLVVVYVRYSPKDHKWTCGAYRLDDCRWSKGCRVFSAATR